jgi:hypothetical protein
MERDTNLRDMVITTETGKDVRDTKMLSGQASDSLSGKNELKQYDTAGGCKGPYGGLPSGK